MKFYLVSAAFIFVSCASPPEAILSNSTGCSPSSAGATGYSSDLEYLKQKSVSYTSLSDSDRRDFEAKTKNLSDEELRDFIAYQAERQNIPFSNANRYSGWMDWLMAGIRGGQNLLGCASQQNALGCVVTDITNTVSLGTSITVIIRLWGQGFRWVKPRNWWF